KGTATRAEVKGYYVGGKTGTSEKIEHGRYSKSKVLNSFMAVLAADQPRYLLLVMLDDPPPAADTPGFATTGWYTMPTRRKSIARFAPLLGLEPRLDLPPADRLILATSRETR